MSEDPCYYCGEPCKPLSGNPNKWPLIMCHADEPGIPKAHHTGCVEMRLAELSRMRAALEEINMMACYACEEDIDSRYAMLLKIGELARAAIAERALTAGSGE